MREKCVTCWSLEQVELISFCFLFHILTFPIFFSYIRILYFTYKISITYSSKKKKKKLSNLYLVARILS